MLDLQYCKWINYSKNRMISVSFIKIHNIRTYLTVIKKNTSTLRAHDKIYKANVSTFTTISSMLFLQNSSPKKKWNRIPFYIWRLFNINESSSILFCKSSAFNAFWVLMEQYALKQILHNDKNVYCKSLLFT